ncbi:MAG: glycosyltransferase [Salinivirgaceae bacterium]|jgi:GT2 family glycosyltransferase
MDNIILSVIIVNYNVRYFLEQCLHSVRKASQDISCEIFVVDNNSYDNSCEMVRNLFPEVKLIENKENLGFSKANNLAIRKSKGKYVLLLNPDTIVQEDTFTKTVNFMESTHDAGGLGVKMIDGNGDFLPESKRGLPKPMTAFYKIFGLSALFPKSKTFGKYHLSYLDPNETHEVDVLSGAFMLMRKSALDKVGLLDETFFMYGEDIDLSYRLQLGGYKNYYFPHTTIVHYKGESTKKSSVNYVMVFYNAMEIFFKKHFQNRLIGIFSICVKFAIYFRAFLAILKRVIASITIPLIDGILIWLFFYFVLPFWEVFKFGAAGSYPPSYITFAVPIYILIFLVSVLYSGGYDKPYKNIAYLRGILIGSGSILLFYSLLNEELRFSRAMIIFSTIFASTVLPLLRVFYGAIGIKGYSKIIPKNLNVLIAGSSEEAEKTRQTISNSPEAFTIIGRVNNDMDDTEKLGSLADMPEISRLHNVDEIVFCSSTLSASEIIDSMMLTELSGVKFKILSPDGIAVVGSSSIQTDDELYNIKLNSIAKPTNLRFKRTIDVALALFILITYPILFYSYNNKSKIISNAFSVLLGKKTWVGYIPDTRATLPPIREGVLNPAMIRKQELSDKSIDKLNRLYAKDYRITNDINIILRCWKNLGN